MILRASWPLFYGLRWTLALQGGAPKKCNKRASNPNFGRLGYALLRSGYARAKSGFAECSTRCRLLDWGTGPGPVARGAALGQRQRSDASVHFSARVVLSNCAGSYRVICTTHVRCRGRRITLPQKRQVWSWRWGCCRSFRCQVLEARPFPKPSRLRLEPCTHSKRQGYGCHSSGRGTAEGPLHF